MSLIYVGPSAVNWAHPLNRALALWYLVMPGGGRGGQWRSLTGRYHGTLTSGPLWSSPRARTGGWGALSYPSGARVALPTPYPEGTTYAIAAWVRQTANTGYRALYANAVPHGLYLTDGAVNYYTGATHTGGTTIALNTWAHVIWSGTGAAASIYVNGVNDGDFTFSSNNLLPGTGIGTPPSVGGDGSGAQLFEGFLDDVRVWQRALSAEDAKQVYRLSRLGHPGLLRRVAATARRPNAAAAATRVQRLLVLGVA